MKLLLLAIALGLTAAAPLEEDKVCQPQSRRWHAILTGGGIYSCSAALINEWWLVTSYTCAPRPYDAIASLGDHDLNAVEGTEQHIEVADVIRHGPYRSPLHSLAMVRLARPARFTQHVQPIPLPTRCPQPGDECRVSGYDRRNLECASVTLVDDQTCRNTFPNDLYWSPTMLCAAQNDTDSCISDVMECEGQVQGVIWYTRGCHNADDPDIYTKLCYYTRWITGVMDRYKPTMPPSTTPKTTTTPETPKTPL
ncbi:trypsinogen-like protein 3 [Polymixia lowei]